MDETVRRQPLGVQPLGRTGLTVSRIGLGLAALGRPGYINVGHASDLAGERDVDAMERRCHDVLDAARDAGITYVDAARSYGRAEAFLASWFPYPDNSHLATPDLFVADAVVVTHEHLDHLDEWALRQLAADVPVVIPRYPSPALRGKLRAAVFERVADEQVRR